MIPTCTYRLGTYQSSPNIAYLTHKNILLHYSYQCFVQSKGRAHHTCICHFHIRQSVQHKKKISAHMLCSQVDHCRMICKNPIKVSAIIETRIMYRLMDTIVVPSPNRRYMLYSIENFLSKLSRSLLKKDTKANIK